MAPALVATLLLTSEHYKRADVFLCLGTSIVVRTTLWLSPVVDLVEPALILLLFALAVTMVQDSPQLTLVLHAVKTALCARPVIQYALNVLLITDCTTIVAILDTTAPL